MLEPTTTLHHRPHHLPQALLQASKLHVPRFGEIFDLPEAAWLDALHAVTYAVVAHAGLVVMEVVCPQPSMNQDWHSKIAPVVEPNHNQEILHNQGELDENMHPWVALQNLPVHVEGVVHKNALRRHVEKA